MPAMSDGSLTSESPVIGDTRRNAPCRRRRPAFDWVDKGERLAQGPCSTAAQRPYPSCWRTAHPTSGDVQSGSRPRSPRTRSCSGSVLGNGHGSPVPTVRSLPLPVRRIPVERAPEQFELVGIHRLVLPSGHGKVPAVLGEVEAERPVKEARDLRRGGGIIEDAHNNVPCGSECGERVVEVGGPRRVLEALLTENLGREVDHVGHNVAVRATPGKAMGSTSARAGRRR